MTFEIEGNSSVLLRSSNDYDTKNRLLLANAPTGVTANTVIATQKIIGVLSLSLTLAICQSQSDPKLDVRDFVANDTSSDTSSQSERHVRPTGREPSSAGRERIHRISDTAEKTVCEG